VTELLVAIALAAGCTQLAVLVRLPVIGVRLDELAATIRNLNL